MKNRLTIIIVSILTLLAIFLFLMERNLIDNGNYNTNIKKQLGETEIKKNIDTQLIKYRNYNNGKIFIYTDINYGQNLKKSDGYVNCHIYAYNLSDTEIIDRKSKIKIRGNSTAGASKKPYNIEFSNKVNLKQFGQGQKWCLLAEAYDPTMLRNKLFLDFANNMNLEYTSSCDFVQVWLDNEYLGCYLLAESIEVGEERVDIDIERGDFLIEYEMGREKKDIEYLTTNHEWRFALVEPKKPNDESLEAIDKHIQEFQEVISSKNYKRVEEMVDIESFSKLYLLNEYAKTFDFDYSSVFFYYRNGKFYAGPVWDFDLSSGNIDHDCDSLYWEHNIISNLHIDCNSYKDIWCDYNLIFNELLEYPEFKREIKKQFNNYSTYMIEMYENSGTIDTIFSKYKKIIDSNYAPKSEDGAGWSYIKYEYNFKAYDDYEENISYLKQWLENRFYFLADEFKDY